MQLAFQIGLLAQLVYILHTIPSRTMVDRQGLLVLSNTGHILVEFVSWVERVPTVYCVVEYCTVWVARDGFPCRVGKTAWRDEILSMSLEQYSNAKIRRHKDIVRMPCFVAARRPHEIVPHLGHEPIRAYHFLGRVDGTASLAIDSTIHPGGDERQFVDQ